MNEFFGQACPPGGREKDNRRRKDSGKKKDSGKRDTIDLELKRGKVAILGDSCLVEVRLKWVKMLGFPKPVFRVLETAADE